MTSLCSSLHPKSGFEFEPQSTDARGFATYPRDAHGLARVLAKADVHGSTPAAILPLTKSSCCRLTRTPGWRNAPDPSAPSPAPVSGGTCEPLSAVGPAEGAWFAEQATRAIGATRTSHRRCTITIVTRGRARRQIGGSLAASCLARRGSVTNVP